MRYGWPAPLAVLKKSFQNGRRARRVPPLPEILRLREPLRIHEMQPPREHPRHLGSG